MPPAHRHRFPSLDAGAWVAAALVAASLLLGALVQQARGQPRTPSGTEPPASHPCEVGDLPDGLLESALATLTRPVTVTAPGWRWTALLPDRVSLGLREQLQEGTGAYLGSTGLLSERAAATAATGYSLKLDWDLKPLWTPPPRPLPLSIEQRLEASLKTEQLAAKLAGHLRKLRAAQAVATQTRAGDPACFDAQADAEAALVTLVAVLRK